MVRDYPLGPNPRVSCGSGRSQQQGQSPRMRNYGILLHGGVPLGLLYLFLFLIERKSGVDTSSRLAAEGDRSLPSFATTRTMVQEDDPPDRRRGYFVVGCSTPILTLSPAHQGTARMKRPCNVALQELLPLTTLYEPL